MNKAAKDDPHAKVHKSGDITLGSKIPYGILSGIPRLDLSIGKPGIPAGRVIEFFGFEMSGKTTAALHTLAQAQLMGGGGIYIDAEYSWDEDRAADIGVDPNKNFAVVEVETIEGIFRQLEASITGLQESDFDKPFVIIVDSITGVTTEHEKGKEFGSEARVGQDARVIRHGMRKIMPDLAKSNACVIFINHAVAKIAASPYAKQSDSSGGHAIKFFSTLRCEFRNSGQIKEGELRAGQKINIRIEKLKKSRLDKPDIKDVSLLVDTGFDLTTELLKASIQAGWVKRPNTKTYAIEYPEETQFPKVDWPGIVQGYGGPQKVYKFLMDWSLENDIIKPWSSEGYE